MVGDHAHPKASSNPSDVAATRWSYLRHNVEDHVPLAAIARDSVISLRTLERWKQAYQAEGLHGLKPRERIRSGGPAPDVVRTIEGLALIRPRQSIATITRIVGGICSEKSWAPPSYTQVRRVIAYLDPGMRVLALEGPVAYRDKYELVLRRRADRPNAIWQADHTMLDILIRGANGKAARPWLIIIIDGYSRAIAGYMVLLGAPTTMNTASRYAKPFGPKAIRRGLSAVSLTSSTSITDPTSQATISPTSPMTCGSG